MKAIIGIFFIALLSFFLASCSSSEQSYKEVRLTNRQEGANFTISVDSEGNVLISNYSLVVKSDHSSRRINGSIKGEFFIEVNGKRFSFNKLEGLLSANDATSFVLKNESLFLAVKLKKISYNMVNIQLKSSEGYPGAKFFLSSVGYLYGQGEIGCRPLLDKDCTGSSEFILNKTSFVRDPFYTSDYNDVITPFWLSMKGVGFFVPDYQLFGVALLPYNNEFSLTGRNSREFSFNLIISDSAVDTFYLWINSITDRLLSVTTDPYNEIVDRMIKRVIWTTWAEFKQDISQEEVLNFYNEIRDHDFPIGIMEIDDKWQKEWGDTDFDPDRFPDPASMVSTLHNDDVLVTLWVPPFVNKNSSNFTSGASKGYFVQDSSGEPYLIPWWDTLFLIPYAGLVDFTNPLSTNWFRNRLLTLRIKYGIDGFKFDAGDGSYLPSDGVTYYKVTPNQFTDYYVKFARETYGYEVRSAYESQNKSIIVREIDKSSDWSDGGLRGVLMQALSLGVIGYPFVLPDMVGGNEYVSKTSSVLMKRWCQLSALLPMVQFSIKPWRGDFSPDVESVCKYALVLREKMIDTLLSLANQSFDTGYPVISPLFFHFPEDYQTYSIDDEFMLGQDLLVAPNLTDSRRRDIYLPDGIWEAMDSGIKYDGPIWLRDYFADWHLPVFERE